MLGVRLGVGLGVGLVLTGSEAVLSQSTCALEDFTISGNIGFDTLNWKACDYNNNDLQREIKTHIGANVEGVKARKNPALYGGLAIIGAGALLAAVWAEVPAAPSVEFGPGRFSIVKTIGW